MSGYLNHSCARLYCYACAVRELEIARAELALAMAVVDEARNITYLGSGDGLRDMRDALAAFDIAKGK